jgi:proteasome lid subunit RPN8/RPN11
MRPVRVTPELLDAMGRHAEETYPEECCGYLVAREDAPSPDAPRTILSALPAPNEFEGERRRRFLLRPEELRTAERRLEGTGQIVAGFYHSHPDHPARPSLFDQEHAWPWYSYLVLAVNSGRVGEAHAFELDPDASEFREVPLLVEGAPKEASTLTVGLRRT